MPAPSATSVAWRPIANAAPGAAATPNDEASTPATANWNTPTLPGMIGKIPTSVETRKTAAEPRRRGAGRTRRASTRSRRSARPRRGRRGAVRSGRLPRVAEQPDAPVQDGSCRPGQTRERGGEGMLRAPGQVSGDRGARSVRAPRTTRLVTAQPGRSTMVTASGPPRMTRASPSTSCSASSVPAIAAAPRSAPWPVPAVEHHAAGHLAQAGGQHRVEEEADEDGRQQGAVRPAAACRAARPAPAARRRSSARR